MSIFPIGIVLYILNLNNTFCFPILIEMKTNMLGHFESLVDGVEVPKEQVYGLRCIEHSNTFITRDGYEL